MLEGLEGLEYSNRGPTSQTAESTIQTSPDSNAAQTPEPAIKTDAVVPQPPAAPVSPAPQQDGNLISELAKTFGKEIGEAQPKEPEPEPAKAPEPPKEKTWRDIEAPPSATKKVQEDWRQFKEKAKAEVEGKDLEIKRLMSELDTTKSQVPQVQQLQEQLRQAQSVVERIAIERSPLFKSKVTDQEDLLRARLGKIVDGTGITAAEADTMLRGDLNTRERLLEARQMSAFRRQQVSDILSQWDRVEEERERMTTRGKETLTEFLREQQVAQEAARAKYIRESGQIFDDQMTLVAKKILVYNPIEGNEGWNKSLNDLKTTARRLYDGNVSREIVAQAAILAPAAVMLQNLLSEAHKQIDELKTQVEKYKGTQPAVRDTGGDVMQPAKALSSSNGDFVKDLVARFQKETGLQ